MDGSQERRLKVGNELFVQYSYFVEIERTDHFYVCTIHHILADTTICNLNVYTIKTARCGIWPHTYLHFYSLLVYIILKAK